MVGRTSVYLNPWLDAYESIPMASFLLLLGAYVSPNAEDRAAHLEGIKNTKPKEEPNGAIMYTKTWIAVFQYPVVATLVAIATDITQAINVLCPNSNGIHFAHLWLRIIQTVSVGAAVTAILRFTSLLKKELKHHSIVKKLLCFKGIVFVYFIQSTVFTFLGGEITPTDKLSYDDITNKLPSLMICIEMIFFSIFFLYAYPWSPYVIRKHAPETVDHQAYSLRSARYQGGFLGLKAIFSALNPAEILAGIVTAAKLAISAGVAARASANYNQSGQPAATMQELYPTRAQEQTANGYGYPPQANY